MIRPIEIEAREGYRIWLRYSDGTTGEVDLSNIAGRGVFEKWNEPGYFEKVYIAPHRAIAWDDDLELCPDSLYMEITGVAGILGPGAVYGTARKDRAAGVSERDTSDRP